jgi:nicotinate-nucleotide adenylyltransferase
MIGILGGTFDPVHQGHLHLAHGAATVGNLQQVLWVPVGHPPHKSAATLTPFHHRAAMVQRAIAAYPQYQLSPVEAQRQGASFAIATLRDLQAQYPDQHWGWILGIDAFQTLPKWYGSRELAAQCHWLVAPRPPFDAIAAAQRCDRVAAAFQQDEIAIAWDLLPVMDLPFSSSQLRQQYCQGIMTDPQQFGIPVAVDNYIRQHHLYGT